MRETGILNPGAKSRRLPIPVGNAPRIDHREKRVAQRHELGWSGTAARGSRGVFRDGRNEESLFEKREVVGDGFQGAGVCNCAWIFCNDRTCAGDDVQTAKT